MGPDRLVGGLFLLAAAAGLGLAVVYIIGGQAQLEGLLLAIALGGIGIGLILWATRLIPHEQLSEPIEVGASSAAKQEDVGEEIARGGSELARRGFLLRALGAAGAALLAAALFPIRSLGPRPGRKLFETPWREGVRVVTADGTPVRVSDLIVGAVLTVFPEGHVGSADGQALLIRVNESDLQLSPERASWAPEGNVVYSKICTHAGCPVGLYRAETAELICPCHQSTFNVLEGARPVFGPAARPLPQLPLTVGPDGFLRARSDFVEPVGAGFWSRPSA